MTLGLLAFGVLLMLLTLKWAFVVEGDKPGEFKRDQYSAERAARLARMQRSWTVSQHADIGRVDRVA